jgi:hypothetical protein
MHLTKNTKEKCVMARVFRQREMHQKNFTLKQYGTWGKAMRAARKWVKEMLLKLPAKISSKNRMTRRNHSGVVGVHWSLGIVKRPNGNIYECPKWVARWPGCPNRGGLSWTDRQFGHKGAFVLAVLSRQHETINRGSILAEFESIHGTKQFRAISDLMRS